MAAAPLVLLPGLLCDASVWAAQERALARDFTIYAMPDFYGHRSLASMAEAVLERAPKRFALAGHSMGGRVAFEIMRAAPERVERLALLSTGFAPAAPDEPAKRQPFIDLALNEGMAALAARWIPLIVHPERMKDRVFVDRLTEMMCRATPEVYVEQVRALLTRPDFGPLLNRISCPTLVACGREDHWTPLAPHEEIASAVPDARLAIVEDCAHMATMEQPAAVTRLLREWLAILAS